MCAPIRDGGRRCAVHQHQNIAAIKLAAKNSRLTRYQTERLFAELTREGRRAAPLTETEITVSHNLMRTIASGLDIKEEIDRELEKSATHDRGLDGPAGYAQKTIFNRAIKRSNNLRAFLTSTAERTGLSYAEVENVYRTGLVEGQRERGGEYPAEYTLNARRHAVNADLPYDVASVVALEKVKALETAQKSIHRITRTPVPLNDNNRWIHSFGYHEGRLEVEFVNFPGQTFAYRDVPEETWDMMSRDQNPYSVFSTRVAGREEYQYVNQEEAVADSRLYKCASCGQFANTRHVCPVRSKREEISKTTPVDKIEEVLKSDPETAEQIIVEETIPAPEEPEIKPELVETKAEQVPEKPEQTVAAPHAEVHSIAYQVPDLTVPNPQGNFSAAEAAAFDVKHAAVASIENQLNPVVKETLVWSGEASGRPILVATSSENTYYLNGASDELKAEMDALTKQGLQVVVDLNNNNPKIVTSFDPRYFTTSELAYGRRTVEIHRAFVEIPQVANAVEQADLLEVEKAKLAGLEAREDVVRITPIATVSKRAKADATVVNVKHVIKAKIGDIREIKAALKEGKAISVPAYMELPSSYSHKNIDDQGYQRYSGAATVEGRIVYRQNKDGAIEMISSPRTLKCNCYNYRNNYHCSHIGYAARHFPNVVAQAAVPSVRAAVSEDPVERARARQLGQLVNRVGVSLVTSKNPKEADYVSFGETISNDYTYEHSYNLRDRFRIPEQYRNNVPLTLPDYFQIIEIDRTRRQLNTLKTPVKMGEVRAALKRGDVAIPVSASFTVGYGNANRLPGLVTGSILYKKTNDPNSAEIRESRLKCTCEVYQKNYSCTHTRFLEAQPALITQVKTRTTIPDGLDSFVRSNDDAFATATGVYNMMENSPEITIDEAIPLYEQQLEEARLARERQAEERRARQAAAEEREREMRERLAREREEQNRETVKNTTAYLERMQGKWNNVDSPYSSNKDSYHADVQAALARKAKGESPIIFKTENVTDGMAAPEAGARRFGVELEFDLSSSANHRKALENIAKDLHAAGLTSVDYQQGYHSAQGDWSSWSFEQDMTVAGEVVSPILSDTPEHWEQLRQVITILKKHGAVTSSRTGSHVHVSTASYGSSTAKNAQLLRDTNADEDVLYRLASNPATGKHRGTRWCGPNVDDQYDDIPADRLEGHSVLRPISYNNHNIAVNFGGATNDKYEKNHVEFRHWDASLDEGVIQQQIVASLGVVDRAERTVLENGGTKKERRTKTPKGSNRNAENSLRDGNNRRKLSREEFDTTNKDAQEFIDSIVRRPEDRAGLAALFAITKWQD